MTVTATEIETDLARARFPAHKGDLVQYAREHDASLRVVYALQELPDREYTSVTDVIAATAGTR